MKKQIDKDIVNYVKQTGITYTAEDLYNVLKNKYKREDFFNTLDTLKLKNYITLTNNGSLGKIKLTELSYKVLESNWQKIFKYTTSTFNKVFISVLGTVLGINLLHFISYISKHK